MEKQSGIKIVDWMLFVFSNCATLPMGAFNREIMENSGFSREKNPIIFGLLYEYYFLSVMIGSTIIFLTFILSLKKETVKYQINHFFFSFIAAFYASCTAASIGYVAYFGRYWYHFPMFCITWNDASAYFVGRSIGRTKLIGLSPKKTVEGFVGALISNFLTTLLFLDYWLQGNNFWTCQPMKITWKPFEDYQCTEVHRLYIQKEYPLPFSFFGFSTFTTCPAVVISLAYTFFAAIIAPFAGFFASGIKRAYQIKDFADTLPGHGGFTDRFDCISLCCFFNFVMVSTVIFRNEVKAESAFRAIQELGPSEQQSILSLFSN
jgi:phosphatidate cytidylyltransferase